MVESNDLIELRKQILDITDYDKIFFILPSKHDGLAYGFIKSYQNEKFDSHNYFKKKRNRCEWWKMYLVRES